MLLLQAEHCSESGGPLPDADHLPHLLSALACGAERPVAVEQTQSAKSCEWVWSLC
jgi:hypothetical protein